MSRGTNTMRSNAQVLDTLCDVEAENIEAAIAVCAEASWHLGWSRAERRRWAESVRYGDTSVADWAHVLRCHLQSLAWQDQQWQLRRAAAVPGGAA